MVRKQNERTLILQYRIIPLSLPAKSILSYFSTSPPFHKIGGFPFPRNIFPQIFSEIFSNQTKVTFFCIFGAKNYGGKGTFCSPNRGGCPFLQALHTINRLYISTGIHKHKASGLLRHSIEADFQPERGKRGQKWIFLWSVLVFSRENRRQRKAKT